MNFIKKIFFINFIICILFFGFKFLRNDSKAIKSLIEKIKIEFNVPPQKNIMKEAYSILTICEYFHSDAKINIDNIRTNSKKELQEIVSYGKQFLSPINSMIEFKSLNVKKPEAFLLLNVKILNSNNPDLLKKEYNLSINLIKQKSKWLIHKVESH